MKRLYAATALLIISTIMIIAVSYAWVTASSAPEAKGIGASFTGNGSLEIALMPSDGNFSGITSGRNASAAFAGGTRQLVEANNKWGNIINLSDSVYGFDLITLRPARINYDQGTGIIGDSVLSVPEWSYDGRITTLRGTYAASHYINDDYAVRAGFKGDRYGVRAIVDVDENTYGFVTDLALRTNAVNENGNPGKLLLQTTGTERAQSLDGSEEVSGAGSTLRFSDTDGNVISDNSEGNNIARKFINCIRIAFIADFGNSAVRDYTVLAFARADENGNLYICDRNGTRVTGDDENVILSEMQKNRIYQVSVLVWLDGDSVTAADVEMSPRFLSTATLNLQFATDVSLTPRPLDVDTFERVVISSGSCGADAVYELDNSGILNVNGTGSVGGYEADNTPWKNNVLLIKEIVVEPGVTEILENAFAGSANLAAVTLPAGITAIGEDAFGECGKLTRVTFGGTVAEWNAISKDNNTELDAATIYCSDGIVYGSDDVCGENAQWALDENGRLTISGTGAISDFESHGAPWYEQRSLIQEIVIGDGITEIGKYAFEGCEEFITVTMPDSVTKINENAFTGCSELYYVNYSGSSEQWNEVTVQNGNTALDIAVIRCSDATLNLPRVIARGSAGNSITWTLDEHGMFILTGSGDMPDYENGEAPWYDHIDSIVRIISANGITSVGNGAFYGASNLTKAALPPDTVKIGEYAFADCVSLESVKGIAAVTEIGEHAFENCGMLTGELPNNLTALGAHAFENCASIKTVNVPSGVTVIPESAFAGCTSLYTVTIAGVTEIGDNAFAGCEKIGYIEIPAAVTSIGDGAFANSGLTGITLPAALTEIGDGAFDGCAALTDVNYAGTRAQWNNITVGNGNGALTAASVYCSDGNLNTTTAVASGSCGENVKWTLDSDGLLTVYGNGPMSDYSGTNRPWKDHKNDIKSIKLSTGVTKIGDYAFYGCSSAESVSIPSSITAIGSAAFNNCGLTAVYINDLKAWCNITSIYHDVDGTHSSNPLLIAGNLYLNGELIENLIIPDDVTSISAYAFSGSGITSIVIPDSVTTIGREAFRYCYNLTSVTIGDGVQSIGYRAFYDNSISEVHITDLASWFAIDFSDLSANPLYRAGNMYLDGILLKDNLIIPDEITVIKPYTFYGYKHFKDLFIHKNVTSIDRSAFLLMDLDTVSVEYENARYRSLANCLVDKSTKTIILGSNNSAIPRDENVTSIMEYAFAECTKLSRITIPGYIKHVGYSAFEGCTGLVSADIQQGVEQIGSSAFRNCYNLASVTIPDSITLIQSETFSGCGSLTGVIIPDSVVNIEDYAFFGCSSLTSITIPDSVASIGEGAFENCSGLISVIIGKNVETIGNGAFYSCSRLTEIVIPNSVTNIGTQAFMECSRLTRVVLPTGITQIPSMAFACCNSLTSIVIPDNVITISGGYGKLYYYGAFYRCTNLREIYFGTGITNIVYCAFYGCDNITNVYYNGTQAQWNSVNIDPHRYTYSYTTDEEGHEIEEVTDHEDGNIKLTDAAKHFGVSSGRIGDSVVFSMNSTGELIAYGSGDTFDYSESPFANTITAVRTAVLHEGITGIGDYLFKDRTQLTSISIPASVETIRAGAFSNCRSLTNVYISDIESWLKIEFTAAHSNPLSYAENLYLNGELVTDITVPDSIESIGKYAFYGYEKLVNVNIPDSVKSIGAGAFCGSGITSVNIPASVEKIEGDLLYGAFSFCDNLQTVTIENGVKTIGSHTFSNCPNLTSVSIPASVTSIGDGAFNGCTSLTGIIYNGKKTQWNSLPKTTGWDNNTGNYTIHCTDGDIEKN